jgi:hypothetical protein
MATSHKFLDIDSQALRDVRDKKEAGGGNAPLLDLSKGVEWHRELMSELRLRNALLFPKRLELQAKPSAACAMRLEKGTSAHYRLV